MVNQYLTSFSVIAIRYTIEQQDYYITASSIFRTKLLLKQANDGTEHSLFFVQREGNQRGFKQQIEYEQMIFLRHKTSNKYLNFQQCEQGYENDLKYTLSLSDNKQPFKIFPCFQYQTKISIKVKFNQEFYLGTEVAPTRNAFLSVKQKQLSIGFNVKSKFFFNLTIEMEKQQDICNEGSLIWLTHIQSGRFLSIDEKNQISFQLHQKKSQFQSIGGLWCLEGQNSLKSHRLQYETKFRFKNIMSNNYMAFSKAYRLVDNQRIYQIVFQKQANDQSWFMFKSIKQNHEKGFVKNDYFFIIHCQSSLTLGCRTKNSKTLFQKIYTFSYFDDEDLFQIKQINQVQEEAFRFIVGVKNQLKNISQWLKQKNKLCLDKISLIEQIYTHIYLKIKILKQTKRIFIIVQNQIRKQIKELWFQLPFYRQKKNQNMIENQIVQKKKLRILKIVYQILIYLFQGNKKNQAIAAQYSSFCIQDFFKEVRAEEYLSLVFVNNKALVCKINQPLNEFNGQNIIKGILIQIKNHSHKKNFLYWSNIQKILILIKKIIFVENKPIDINQRLVSQQLFKNNYFQNIFFAIKVLKDSIVIYNQQNQKFQPLQQIKDKQKIKSIEGIIYLLSDLCINRNQIAKKIIHGYFSQHNSTPVSVFISYLTRNLSEQLFNAFLSLISNLYADSCPRINRLRPLSVVFFLFKKDISQNSKEQMHYSGKLREVLQLQIQESHVCRPLYVSTLMKNQSNQPSLNIQELVQFRLIITQELLRYRWSVKIFQSILLMLRLQSYIINEIMQIHRCLLQNIQVVSHSSALTVKSFEVLQQIFIVGQQLQLKKMTSYLKHKFSSDNKNLIDNQICYVLPGSLRIPIAMRVAAEGETQYSSQYNQLRDTLAQMHPSKETNQKLIDMFCQKKNCSTAYLSAIFKVINKYNSPKRLFLEFLMKSIVLTHDEGKLFDDLFHIYKKLKHLSLISQFWIHQGQGQNSKHFLKNINEITNFMFDEYLLNSQDPMPKKNNQLNINRQLLIANMGFHQITFQFLQKNFYLIKNIQSRKQLKKRQFDVFQATFVFLINFIKKCDKNRDNIYYFKHILFQYGTTIQLGQNQLYCEFFNQQPSLIQQITPELIDMFVERILKNNSIKKIESQEYNPDLLNIFIVLAENSQSRNKKLINIIYNKITKEDFLQKILFLEKGQKITNFCLSTAKLKLQPVQMPIAYHIKIIQFINCLSTANESIKKNLRLKLIQIISFQTLLKLLLLPDIFTNLGIQSQLNFLLKRQIVSLVIYYLGNKEVETQLYDNDNFLELLHSYHRIFFTVIKKIQIVSQNQSIYLPFLEPYQKLINQYEENPFQYYLKELNQFLITIKDIFIKIDLQQNRIGKVLKKLLTELQSKKIDSKIKSQKKSFDLSDVKIKWINFVDADIDNSFQEKYIKKTILQILRSKKTQQIINQQEKQFIQLIKQNQQHFLRSLFQLIKLLSQQQQSDSNKKQIHVLFETSLKVLKIYVDNLKLEETKIVLIIFEKYQFIQTIMKLFSLFQFDLQKIHYRKLFYKILCIFNFLLKYDADHKVARTFQNILTTNNTSYRYLQLIKEAALSIVDKIQKKNGIEQINSALQQMRLIVEPKAIKIEEEAFKFITYIGSVHPFPSFLRYQFSYFSVDFLEKIYKILFFLIDENDNINISVITVHTAQFVLNFIISMFANANTINQNYILDNKFSQLVAKILRLTKIKKKAKEFVKRQELLNKIINFYQSNGIQIRDLLQKKLRVVDFDHPYLLNRLKYSLLRTLLQCTITNQLAINKIQTHVSLDLIKVNLICLFEQYKARNIKYSQSSILRMKLPWEELASTQNLDPIFLRSGFYYFKLITLYQSKNLQNIFQNQEAALDEQKQKQRIIKKFFNSLSEPKKSNKKAKTLTNESMTPEMLQNYQIYYQALLFFKQNTAAIEVSIDNRLQKVYFPILPIARMLDQDYKQTFRDQINRISRQQKLKSLLELQSKFYISTIAEIQFQKNTAINLPRLSFIFKYITKEKDLNFISLILGCFLTMFYLLDDYVNSSYQFTARFFFYLQPISVFRIFILLISILCFLTAILLTFFLFFRKISLSKKLLQNQYDESQQKIKQQWYYKKSLYVFINILKDSFYSLYTILFLFLSLIHPFFSSFLLIQAITRIQLGIFVAKSIKQTAPQLLVTTSFLLVFNFIYSQVNYEYLTSDVGYGAICSNFYTCMLFLTDQNIKSGSGIYGSVNETNNLYLVFNIKFFIELFYMIFCQKVIFQIFSGLIIDKFSELRQREQNIVEDQTTQCFICALQRFDIDLQLEGFQTHVNVNHNAFNYIYYIFYVRRVPLEELTIIQRRVAQCIDKKKIQWIPNRTSLEKISKSKLNQDNKQQKQQQKQQQNYCCQKLSQFKKIKNSVQFMINQINNIKKHKK